MIDVRLLRNSPDAVRVALERRAKPDILDQVDHAIRLDGRLRDIVVERDDLRRAHGSVEGREVIGDVGRGRAAEAEGPDLEEAVHEVEDLRRREAERQRVPVEEARDAHRGRHVGPLDRGQLGPDVPTLTGVVVGNVVDLGDRPGDAGEGDDREQTDAELDDPRWGAESSLKAIAAQNRLPYSQLLRGPSSFGALMEREGYDLGPQPKAPRPKPARRPGGLRGTFGRRAGR